MATNITNLSKKQRMYIGIFLLLAVSILGEITSVEFVVKLLIALFSISIIGLLLFVGFNLLEILKGKKGGVFNEL